MKSEESLQDLRFVVVNDPEHDFDLLQEAWIGDWMVALLRRVGWEAALEWRVSFLSPLAGSQECELPWETVQKIMQAFAAFLKEMKSENTSQ